MCPPPTSNQLHLNRRSLLDVQQKYQEKEVLVNPAAFWARDRKGWSTCIRFHVPASPLSYLGVVGCRHLEEIQSQLFGVGLPVLSADLFGVLMFALGPHQHSLESGLVVQFFHFVQPLEGVAEGLLVGAVVDHHHEVRVLAHAEGDRLVEFVSAEVEEEEFY